MPLSQTPQGAHTLSAPKPAPAASTLVPTDGAALAPTATAPVQPKSPLPPEKPLTIAQMAVLAGMM